MQEYTPASPYEQRRSRRVNRQHALQTVWYQRAGSTELLEPPAIPVDYPVGNGELFLYHHTDMDVKMWVRVLSHHQAPYWKPISCGDSFDLKPGKTYTLSLLQSGEPRWVLHATYQRAHKKKESSSQPQSTRSASDGSLRR